MKQVFGLFICLIAISFSVFSQVSEEKPTKETKAQKTLSKSLKKYVKQIQSVKFVGCEVEIEEDWTTSRGSNDSLDFAYTSRSTNSDQYSNNNAALKSSSNYGRDTRVISLKSNYVFKLSDIDTSKLEVASFDTTKMNVARQKYYKNKFFIKLNVIDSERLIKTNVSKRTLNQSAIVFIVKQKDGLKLADNVRQAILECSK